MITPDCIRLFCTDCEPPQFVTVPRKAVRIKLDLEKDQYEFRSCCPECNHGIYNTRGVYR